MSTIKTKAKKTDCFVIMPFSDPQGYEQGHFTRVWEDIILPGCVMAGVVADRGDSTNKPNVIHVDIVRRLVEAPLAICDLSARNPNVMFELGIRQAFCLPTVLMSDTTTPAIFDVAPIRCLPYDRNLKYHDVLNDQKRLAQVVKETIYAKEPLVNSILQIAKVRTAEFPSEIKIQNSGDVAHLLQQLIMKIDALSRPLNVGGLVGSSEGSFELPVPGLSACDSSETLQHHV